MNCCICGTVKNCEPYLNRIFNNIEIIRSLFNDYKIIVYYDISNDNTLKILNNYQKKNPKLIIYINKKPLSKFRTFRISKGRNVCLKYIINNKDYYQYFIMMDFDDVNCKNINIEPLRNSLKRNDWDGLSFNKYFYYDIWALSINPYYLSCAHIGDEAGKIMLNYITNKLNNINKDELLLCASAFNGFSIYRTEKFVNCYYSGALNLKLLPKHVIKNNISLFNNKFNYHKIDDCEHRHFHLMAINNNQAKIMISPEIIFP